MDLTHVLISFAAGLLTFFSPCAFAMFPAYIAYLLNVRPTKSPLASGLIIGTLASLSVSLVFLVVGILSSLIIMELMAMHYYIQIGLALLLIVLGIVLLLGGKVFLPLNVSFLRRRGSFYSLSIMYGVAYALASLSCSFPVFLAVVVSSAIERGLIVALVSFLAYTLGLVVPMVLVAVVTVLSKELVLSMYKKIAKYIERVSGVLLVVAGLYILSQYL